MQARGETLEEESRAPAHEPRGEMQRKLARITATTDWTGFSNADLVIEAVIEKLDVKRQVLAEFEALAKPGAIFASNTSTIPITDIAANAQRPGERRRACTSSIPSTACRSSK